ncbi:spore germination protein [Effusibacillus consociatus]|uniref:Spore germination protein n=1 Tax=Effusibacillus consociatus TaxID=1117041 RepID=A0ABV9Q629_9BACL
MNIRKKINRKKEQVLAERLEQTTTAYEGQPLSGSLDQDLEKVRNVLGESDDVIIREFEISRPRKQRAAIVYIDGLVDTKLVNEFLLKPLVSDAGAGSGSDENEESDLLKRIPMSEARLIKDFRQLIKAVLSGDTVLLREGGDPPLSVSSKGWKKRGVEEPLSESVVRGPRDAFTETLRINTAQIRRRLKDPNLRLQGIKVGKRTDTDVVVVYIEGVANPDVLKEVQERIKRIEIDGALESGYIEQFIEDHHWSPFPQIQNTERPDRAAAALLEGKIVILVDGTPFIMIAPATFTQFYNSPEDYYERFLIASMIRSIRLISMFMALLLPSLYIAFSSFHPEMIPSKLVIAMAAGRATVPFSSIIEAFLMEITMEILREASVRLPGPVGPTIGIVGALVVGESAVRAGIVSPVMVIIVALTTIGSFASPSYSASIALRMLRFPLMLFAGTLGLYGIMLFLIAITIHLCNLESFGIPYLSPMAPRRVTGWKDTFYRTPLYQMVTRPPSTMSVDPKRVIPSTAEGVKKGESDEQADTPDQN